MKSFQSRDRPDPWFTRTRIRIHLPGSGSGSGSQIPHFHPDPDPDPSWKNTLFIRKISENKSTPGNKWERMNNFFDFLLFFPRFLFNFWHFSGLYGGNCLLKFPKGGGQVPPDDSMTVRACKFPTMWKWKLCVLREIFAPHSLFFLFRDNTLRNIVVNFPKKQPHRRSLTDHVMLHKSTNQQIW